MHFEEFEDFEGFNSFDDEPQRAYRKILRMASVREVSTESVKARLARDGYSESAIDASLQRALGNRIIDNERYADALIRSRLAAGKGMHVVVRDLESLGVDVQSLDSYQEHESMGDQYEIERAIAVLNKRSITAKNKRDAAYRRLIQAGYSSDVASQAASEWMRSQFE